MTIKEVIHPFAALDKLIKDKNDFAKFLATVTKILEGDLASGLQIHVNQSISAFDNYVSRDCKTTYVSSLEAYEYMSMTGSLLSGAIANMTYALRPNNWKIPGLGVTHSRIE